MKAKRRVNRYRAMAKRVSLLIVSLILLCFLAVSFKNIKSVAHENDRSFNKFYMSIEIEPGDSLWSIANHYMTDDYSSIDAYINELRSLNNLESDELIAGNYLSVVCVAEE